MMKKCTDCVRHVCEVKTILIWILVWLHTNRTVNALVTDEQLHMAEDSPTRESVEVSSLFTSIAPKSTPLYICDESLGGIEYRPPGTIDCDTDPKDNDTVSVVEITVYFNDLTHHSIKGYECTGWVDKTEVGKSGAFQWTKVTRRKAEITPEQCLRMIQDKIDPKGNKFHLVTEEVWKTQNVVDIEHGPWYYPFYNYYAEVSNYRIQEVSVGIAEADGIVKSIAYTEKPCHYNESYCSTDLGFLLWKPEDVRTCRLLEGEKSNCLLRVGSDGTTLTCPDLKIVLREVEYIRMCNEWFGSSHGVYFLQNEQGQINEQMATPEKVRKMLTKPRRKRSVQNARVHALEAEIKLNLNYLYDTLRNHTKEVMRKLEKEICEVTKRQVEMISTIAQSGHPSLTMRYMYNIPSLRAEFVGDLLQIYQCIEINEWMLEERKECTFQWPVKYVFRHEMYHGYIGPITHTIIQRPVKQKLHAQGSCKKFYFQANNYVARLVKDTAIKVNVDTLPFASVGRHGKDFMPDLTFLPRGHLAESADENFASVLKLIRNSGIRDESFKTRPLITGGETITVTNGKPDVFGGIDAMFSGMFGQLLGPIVSFLGYLIQFIIWAVVICIVGLVLLVLIKTHVLCAIVKLPFKLISTLCRSCWKSLCRRQFRRLVRSRRIHEFDYEHGSKPLIF